MLIDYCVKPYSPVTRSRNSFNVERMVVHTVKEVKKWGDPNVVMATCSSSSASALGDVLPEGGDTGAMMVGTQDGSATTSRRTD